MFNGVVFSRDELVTLIKCKCLDCCGGIKKEVRLCCCLNCSLYALRNLRINHSLDDNIIDYKINLIKSINMRKKID